MCRGVLPRWEETRDTLSRLTTLSRAVGNDKSFKVKVIEEEQEVGNGKGEEAKGKELEDDKLCGLQ